MPSFFGYVRYSVGVLGPIFLGMAFLFYRSFNFARSTAAQSGHIP